MKFALHEAARSAGASRCRSTASLGVRRNCRRCHWSREINALEMRKADKGGEGAMLLAVELGKGPGKCDCTSRVVKPLTTRLLSAIESTTPSCIITKLPQTCARLPLMRSGVEHASNLPLSTFVASQHALHQRARRNVWMSSIDISVVVWTSENNRNDSYLHFKVIDSF